MFLFSYSAISLPLYQVILDFLAVVLLLFTTIIWLYKCTYTHSTTRQCVLHTILTHTYTLFFLYDKNELEGK